MNLPSDRNRGFDNVIINSVPIIVTSEAGDQWQDGSALPDLQPASNKRPRLEDPPALQTLQADPTAASLPAQQQLAAPQTEIDYIDLVDSDEEEEPAAHRTSSKEQEEMGNKRLKPCSNEEVGKTHQAGPGFSQQQQQQQQQQVPLAGSVGEHPRNPQPPSNPPSHVNSPLKQKDPAAKRAALTSLLEVCHRKGPAATHSGSCKSPTNKASKAENAVLRGDGNVEGADQGFLTLLQAAVSTEGHQEGAAPEILCDVQPQNQQQQQQHPSASGPPLGLMPLPTKPSSSSDHSSGKEKRHPAMNALADKGIHDGRVTITTGYLNNNNHPSQNKPQPSQPQPAKEPVVVGQDSRATASDANIAEVHQNLTKPQPQQQQQQQGGGGPLLVQSTPESVTGPSAGGAAVTGAASVPIVLSPQNIPQPVQQQPEPFNLPLLIAIRSTTASSQFALFNTPQLMDKDFQWSCQYLIERIRDPNKMCGPSLAKPRDEDWQEVTACSLSLLHEPYTTADTILRHYQAIDRLTQPNAPPFNPTGLHGPTLLCFMMYLLPIVDKCVTEAAFSGKLPGWRDPSQAVKVHRIWYESIKEVVKMTCNSLATNAARLAMDRSNNQRQTEQVAAAAASAIHVQQMNEQACLIQQLEHAAEKSAAYIQELVSRLDKAEAQASEYKREQEAVKEQLAQATLNGFANQGAGGVNDLRGRENVQAGGPLNAPNPNPPTGQVKGGSIETEEHAYVSKASLQALETQNLRLLERLNAQSAALQDKEKKNKNLTAQISRLKKQLEQQKEQQEQAVTEAVVECCKGFEVQTAELNQEMERLHMEGGKHDEERTRWAEEKVQLVKDKELLQKEVEQSQAAIVKFNGEMGTVREVLDKMKKSNSVREQRDREKVKRQTEEAAALTAALAAAKEKLPEKVPEGLSLADVSRWFETFLLNDSRVPVEVRNVVKYHAQVRDIKAQHGAQHGVRDEKPSHLAARLDLPVKDWSNEPVVTEAIVKADKAAEVCSMCSKCRYACSGCGSKAPKPRTFRKALQSQQGLFETVFNHKNKLDVSTAAA